MIKTIVLASVAAALLSTSALAQTSQFKYYGVSDAVFYKKNDQQVFNVGEIRLTHNKEGEKSSMSSTPIIRDYFSLDAFQNHTQSKNGSVETTSAIQGFKFYTGGTRSYTIATADAISSVSVSTQSAAAGGQVGQTASSQFVNLRILGMPFAPSGTPNQAYEFTVANYGRVKIVFNSEKIFSDGRISHSAVRISLPNGEQYFIAHVAAGATVKQETP